MAKVLSRRLKSIILESVSVAINFSTVTESRFTFCRVSHHHNGRQACMHACVGRPSHCSKTVERWDQLPSGCGLDRHTDRAVVAVVVAVVVSAAFRLVSREFSNLTSGGTIIVKMMPQRAARTACRVLLVALDGAAGLI